MSESAVASRAPGTARRAIQIVAPMGIWIAGLFLGAGTAHWARGWISSAVYVIGMTVSGLIVRRANPGLIAERANWRRKDTKGFDKVFLAALMPLAMLQPVVGGMDAVRFGWLPISLTWLWPGIVLCGAAMSLVKWTLAVNRHAETTVRIQADRGHTVVTTGPYGFVRHPMYSGCILMFFAIPLMWGSGAAMAISVILSALFVWRTVMEDRTLQSELPGYPEYARRTVFKLIPGIW